ncbi:MAG TPA: hypothetical protein VNE62_10945 [Actinomycetota bacterium]|nr:hypothetical protein [Actinomycetota bacterium]
MTRKVWLWGLAAATLYAAVAAATFGTNTLPSRPLFDGLAPPVPYNWVEPPRGLKKAAKPTGAQDTIPLDDTGSAEKSIATVDGQAFLVFKKGSFAPQSGETGVSVTLEPVSINAIPAKPPGDKKFDGNGYRVRATYQPSGRVASPTQTMTVVLRYARHGTHVFAVPARGRPRQLKSTATAANLQVFAESDTLGTFVPVGNPAPPPKSDLRTRLEYLAVGAAATLLGAAVYYGLPALKRRRTVPAPPPGKGGRAKGKPKRRR